MLPAEPLEDPVTKGLRLSQHLVDLGRRHHARPVVVGAIAQGATRIKVHGRVSHAHAHEFG